MDSKAMVAINLSTEQFKSGNLVDVVRNALASADLQPSRLELEITESLILDNSTDVAMQIDTLKEMGVSVAMDDFGTGFSSLSYLWKFGFDRIKIDRSFIQALEEDPDRSLGLIETIILLGEKLDMRITAEGIETQYQSEILSSLGCDVLQGFYYGRPKPLESLSEKNCPGDRPQQQAG
jgi:EAL domain-containing protein (putative c-di-GMP-specific phosphodiesterase class I)